MFHFNLALAVRGASSGLWPYTAPARFKLIRLMEWGALFGCLLGLEFARTSTPLADDLLAYKVAALLGLTMFFFLPAWMLATLLTTLCTFIAFKTLTSDAMTPGAAIVVSGISPVLAFLLAWLEEQQARNRRGGPDWLADDPFFDLCGRRR